MVASHCLREVILLQGLLIDVECKQDREAFIMCVNQGTIALAKNRVHHRRTKHIEVQHHFIWEKVERSIIRLEYCPTKHMVADVLTKAFAKDQYEKLTKIMGFVDLSHLQSGSVER